MRGRTTPALLVVFALCVCRALAFQTSSPPSSLLPYQHHQRQRRPFLTTSRLHMSDVPREDEDDNASKDDKGFFFKLPPPPQDTFVMTGDLMSLFLYAFTDHFVCQDLAAMADLKLDLQHPVWLDVTHSYREHVMNVISNDYMITSYSPMLQPMGLAACVMASSWLLAGWWHEAFSVKNTIECSTERTLVVTLKAWLTSCVILMGLTAMTNGGAFTKGDLDYIWDSLTVLTVWRFMLSALLGYGQDDD